MATVHQIKTWATSQADEDAMNVGHAILWRRMIELLAERSLDDYARAFRRAGFDVLARPFQVDEFVPINVDCNRMANVAAKLAYYTGVKTLFRLVKPA